VQLNTYEWLLVRQLLKNFLRDDGRFLVDVGGVGLAKAREQFRDLDDRLYQLEAIRILATRLQDHPPPGIDYGPRRQWTDYALIKNEISKQKRHIPVRHLIRRAAGALQTMKPVWLMSPLSVAQYVPPGTASFDLVVIDEASQMRPEYAVGAIARGKQVVVVGDTKQLPPTDFFEVKGVDQEDDEDYDVDTESILDLALTRFNTARRLKWHYRSQHASLIAFSNREFYDRDLVVFPNPVTRDDLLGVKHIFVGGTYGNRVNEKEAQAVIEAAVGLIYARPELSIGIATMNSDQRDLIFREFERILEDDDKVRSYYESCEKTIEPIFIKNLENVQGDERDVIIISTLYGPEPGKTTVAQRFGPINSANGHRRLNVLFTRAKMSTMIFTSLKPSDIVVNETSSRGLRALKSYLEYAAGGAIVDDPLGGEPDSDFELFVADHLRSAGYEVVHQVGVEGFRIDLGVKHPSYPIGFIAGIECDGATYHSGLTVRDRDRIRQDILEGLGWRIYRVWSTDWFNDRNRETEHLLSWLEKHREKAAARFEIHQQAVRASTVTIPPERPKSAEPTHAISAKRRKERSAPRRATTRVHKTSFAEAAPLREVAPEAGTAAAQGHFALLARIPSKNEPPVAVRRAPEGRKRTLGDIDYYEIMPGYFEIWIEDRAIGDVQRLSTGPVQAARLHGSRLVAPRPQYRASVYDTTETLNYEDIYVAIRDVVRRAKERMLKGGVA
jgi:very-short-patch-repair endonuclease